MSLPIVCPVCGASYPVEAGLQDAEARRALAAAMELPAPLAAQVVVYLGLHAPAKKRLAWSKLTRLITELVALLHSGEVTRDRETRPAPQPAWAEGLATIVEMRDAGELSLPLDGHGLLCEIVHRRATKAQARQQAASRPLHPSHRPAVMPDPAPEGAAASPPPAQDDWAQRRTNGTRHIGALLGALVKPTDTNPNPEDQP